jgi:pyridoxamine 5'-phosphate oxidase
MSSIADLRRDYALASLEITDVVADPVEQFRRWFANATESAVLEPNAMTLATVGPDGQPDARIVLLKGADARGFTFFTDYRSEKGQNLSAHPAAALVFFWPELERQVRIRGSAQKLSAEESSVYYNSRPLGSRIGAWASEQSSVIADRTALEARVRELTATYTTEAPPPLPSHWGGYLIAPTQLEFWQGRQSRLHDRIRYRRSSSANDAWTIERLSP